MKWSTQVLNQYNVEILLLYLLVRYASYQTNYIFNYGVINILLLRCHPWSVLLLPQVQLCLAGSSKQPHSTLSVLTLGVSRMYLLLYCTPESLIAWVIFQMIQKNQLQDPDPLWERPHQDLAHWQGSGLQVQIILERPPVCYLDLAHFLGNHLNQ